MHKTDLLCDLCKQNGKTSLLYTYQINFTEAVTLCENPQCTYPVGIGSKSPNFIVNRDLSSIPETPQDVGKQSGRNSSTSVSSLRRSSIEKFKSSRDLSRTDSAAALLQKRKKIGTDSNPTFRDNGCHIEKTLSKTYPSSFQQKKGGTTETEYVYQAKKIGLNGQEHTVNEIIPELSGVSVCDSNVNLSRKNEILCNQGNVGSECLKKKQLQFPKVEKRPVFSAFKFGQTKSSQEKSLLSDSLRINELKTLQQVSQSSSPLQMEIALEKKVYWEHFLQWRNKDALCWLDVLLCLLVHNQTVGQLCRDQMPSESVIKNLLLAHKQAQLLTCSLENGSFQHYKTVDDEICVVGKKCDSQISTESQEKHVLDLHSNGSYLHTSVTGALQTGAGKQPSLLTDKVDEAVVASGAKAGDKSNDMLDEIRERVWQLLKPSLRCEKGRNDSPVFAFPLIVRSDQQMEKLFSMKCKFQSVCPACRHTEVNTMETLMPSIPKVVEDFTIARPTHFRTCINCGFQCARRTLIYERLPETFLIHFIDGLEEGHLQQLDLKLADKQYSVTGLVQYKRDPDHFIAWLRNPSDGRWMECDDLKAPVCSYNAGPPLLPSSEIHIVMWERVSSPSESRTESSTRNEKFCPNSQRKLDGLHPVGDELVVQNSGETVKTGKVKNFLEINEDSNCSSMSSECSELSDMSDLPQFTTSTPVVPNLVKPVACKTATQLGPSDGKVQNSIDPANKGGNSETFAQNISSSFTDPVIKPSTVFCIPSKMSRESCGQKSDRRFDTNNHQDPKSVALSVTSEDKTQNIPKHNDFVILTSLNHQELNTNLSNPASSNNQQSTRETSVPVALTNNKDTLNILTNNRTLTIANAVNGGYTLKFVPSTSILPVVSANNSTGGVVGQPIIATVNRNTAITASNLTSSKTSGNSFTNFRTCQTVTPSVSSANPVETSNGTRKTVHANGSFKTPESVLLSQKAPRIQSFTRFNRQSSVSRDAFMTLKSLRNGRANDSKHIPVSSSPSPVPRSPGQQSVKGNMQLLTSVKQYLLEKTTQIDKPKFEGMNLQTVKRSSSLRKSGSFTGLTLGGNTDSQAHSSGGSMKNFSRVTPVAARPSGGEDCTSPSISVRSDSVLIGKRRCSGSLDTVRHNGVKKLCQADLRSHNEPVLGKLNSISDVEHTAVETATERENKFISAVDTSSSQKFTVCVQNKIGTSDSNSCEKSNGFHGNEISESPVVAQPGLSDLHSSEKLQTHSSEPEECNVLQDLYQALNIPLTEMDSMMSEAMDGMDDFLDLLESSPMPGSCPSTPSKTTSLSQVGPRCEALLSNGC